MNDNKNLAEIFEQKMTENQAFNNSEKLKKRHEESLRKYPEIAVDDDEYVILSLNRHGIGLVGIAVVTAFISVVLISAWIILCFMPNRLEVAANMKGYLSMIFGSLTLLVILSGIIGYSTYVENRFVITNERAIQWIVRGILNKQKQIINLESVEDISYTQVGVLQHLLNFGTIRLSTTGDESTYTFPLTRNPAKQVEILSDIAECARAKQFIPDELLEKARIMR